MKLNRTHRSARSPGIAHTAARGAVGLLLAGHGLRKLSSVLGGPGLPGATAQMENLKLHPPKLNAIAAGVTQLVGGTLTATGLLTPVGCALISSNMMVAMRTACAGRGPWGTNGGWEYPLVLGLSATAIAERGAGPLSLDRRLGIERSGPLVATVTAGAALTGAALVLSRATGRPPEA
jgi:putative oxidoreductase